MAKGQKRSGREAKKPKAAKPVAAPSPSLINPVRPLPSKGQGKKPSLPHV